MNPKVDWFFDKDTKWKKEYAELRTIILDCGLTEELKWGVPCYTFRSKNVVLIHGFKDYCAVLFHKGVLLKNTENLLIQQTENVQAARQLRFADLKQITEQEEIIQDYVEEAIEVEKSGQKIALKKTEDFEVPEEFQVKIDKDPDLKRAFYTLTPGRQRAYLFYFSQAKRSQTRKDRVEKFIPKILDGKGKDD